MRLLIALFPVLVTLAGCDQLGIETPAQQQVRADAEGRAMGSACRHSGRALEDCYQINKRASKAAIYAGWRDMDAYMRENKIQDVTPGSGAASISPRNKPLAPESGTAAPAGDAPAKEEAGTPNAPAAGKKISAASGRKSGLAERRAA